MADAKVDKALSGKLKLYEEEDELELFAVQIMTNLMKHCHDANHVVMPALPRRSKFYNTTIRKSVTLGWHVANYHLSQRFRRDYPIMCRSRRDLFQYAVCQAQEFFANMEPASQLIYFAAYCYTLTRFLTRNGHQEYIYVSYTLFTTVWRDLFEETFNSNGGWKKAAKKFKQFALALEAAEEIFFPGYQFGYDDIHEAMKEYQMVVEKPLEWGEEELEREIARRFGELPVRRRTRLVTYLDTKLLFMSYVFDAETLDFMSVVNPPEKWEELAKLITSQRVSFKTC